MWPSRIPLPGTVVLAVVATWLSVLVLHQDRALMTALVRDAQAASPPADTGATVVAPAKLDSAEFTQTLLRPLFMPSRRPNAPAAEYERALAEQPVTVSVASQIVLLGVLETEQNMLAYLTMGQVRDWVAVGESFDKWQVLEITENRVVLSHDDIHIEKLLYSDE